MALINGTDGMLAQLVLALADLESLLDAADLAAALSVEGQLATDKVFAADLMALRPQVGQATSAANLRRLLAGSPIVASHRVGDGVVQDAYSLRCSPQVHGSLRDAVEFATTIAERELAAAIDNPSVLDDGGSPRTATSTAPRWRTSWTSWPSASRTWRASLSGAPTASWTPTAAVACRRSWRRSRHRFGLMIAQYTQAESPPG